MATGDEIINYEVLSSLSSHIAVIDRAGMIIAVNKTWDDFARENGARWLVGVSTGSNYFDVCNAAILEGDRFAKLAMDGISAVFRGEKKIFELEYPCDSPLEKRWFLLHVMILGEDNSMVVASHQNITGSKNSEQGLKASELKYRRLFEAAKDGILIVNASSGKIIDVNPFLVTRLGYPYHFFIGKELWQIGLFSDVEESKKAFLELRKNKYIRYENLPLKKQDGGIMHVEFISNVYDVNNENVIQCNIRDITEQFQTTLRLQESEWEYKGLSAQFQNESARLLEAQKVAKIGSWEIIVADLTLIWSREVYRIFELDPLTFSPTWEKFFEYTHPEDREKIKRAFVKSYEKEIISIVEHRIVTASGKLKYVIEHWEVVKDANGVPVRTIGTCQDITDKKKKEFETQELLKQVQTKNKDLRQFTYILSHNLRAHIAKIQGLVFLINKSEDNIEENLSFLQLITEEVVGLDDVIKDLNQILSVQDIGNKALEYVDFEILLKQIKQVLSDEIKVSGTLITADFSEVPGLHTIKSYCYSIVYNLLSNAIKYRSAERQSTIHVKTTGHDAFVCLSVKDNGLGIDLKKNEKKIFSLYKRFHGNTIPGKGMGLNLVKVQTESMGGRVELLSEVNQGCEFKIYLPIQ